MREILSIVGPLVGLMVLIIGVAALIAPRFASKAFGIDIKDQNAAYVIAAGARDIFIGITILILCLETTLQVTAHVFLGLAVVSTTDCVLTFRNGSQLHSMMHLSATFAIVGYALIVFFLI